MLKIKWLDATEAKKFGALMANLVINRTPKSPESMKENRLTKIHESMIVQLDKKIADFRKTHTLNIYTKAQMGNVFKWTLLERKYDSDYVDQLTTYILRRF